MPFRAYAKIWNISIHALREEGDPVGVDRGILPCDFNPRPPRGGRLLLHCRRCRSSCISIHALREEGDAPAPGRVQHLSRFQSTPSARRATEIGNKLVNVVIISIHALREEGDERMGDRM